MPRSSIPCLTLGFLSFTREEASRGSVNRLEEFDASSRGDQVQQFDTKVSIFLILLSGLFVMPILRILDTFGEHREAMIFIKVVFTRPDYFLFGNQAVEDVVAHKVTVKIKRVDSGILVEGDLVDQVFLWELHSIRPSHGICDSRS